jgi:hypothetical protein
MVLSLLAQLKVPVPKQRGFDLFPKPAGTPGIFQAVYGWHRGDY